MPATYVRSSPPVICTGNFIGPSCRHTCGIPVTGHVKNMRVPRDVNAPPPAPRTSSIAWIRRVTAAGNGGAANRAMSAGATLSAPSPE